MTKFTIITPSFNSGDSIEHAISSVLDQKYDAFEHIVVDGGSSDNTLEILERYPHLRWISEPDEGQIDAIMKGVAMSSGDAIGILNADDFYLEGAFEAVASAFDSETEFVVGKVLVRSEKSGGVHEWVNDARVDLDSMLRHWEADAFCVNPIGYFYRREVQERAPYKMEYGAKHDLAFLIEAAAQGVSFRKVDRVLGVFNHAQETQTGREQSLPSYWHPSSFPFIDPVVDELPADKARQYRQNRDFGYQLRRHWTAMEALESGHARDLIESGEILFLPEDEDDVNGKGDFVVDHDRIATPGDTIIAVLTMGKVASKSIHTTLKSLPKDILPCEVYHIHQFNLKTLFMPRRPMAHMQVSKSLKALWDKRRDDFKWKFITGMRDPVAAALSGVFEIQNKDLDQDSVLHFLNKHLLPYKMSWFERQFKAGTGIDILQTEFDKENGYGITRMDNVEVYSYALESLNDIFTQSMQDLLGIAGLHISKSNSGAAKAYKDSYTKARKNLVLDDEQIQAIYNAPVVQHFYTDEKIQSFVSKWSKRS